MWSDHTSFREQQPLVLFFPCLIISKPPSPPVLTLLACGSICMDRQIRRAASVSDKGVWVPLHAGRAGADATPPQLFTNGGRNWIGLTRQRLSFLSIYPPPSSRLNFPMSAIAIIARRWRFPRQLSQTGESSKQQVRPDSFWTSRGAGGRGLLDLICNVLYDQKGRMTLVEPSRYLSQR